MINQWLTYGWAPYLQKIHTIPKWPDSSGWWMVIISPDDMCWVDGWYSWKEKNDNNKHTHTHIYIYSERCWGIAFGVPTPYTRVVRSYHALISEQLVCLTWASWSYESYVRAACVGFNLDQGGVRPNICTDFPGQLLTSAITPCNMPLCGMAVNKVSRSLHRKNWTSRLLQLVGPFYPLVI